jgi:hypothetical protein
VLPLHSILKGTPKKLKRTIEAVSTLAVLAIPAVAPAASLVPPTNQSAEADVVIAAFGMKKTKNATIPGLTFAMIC